MMLPPLSLQHVAELAAFAAIETDPCPPPSCDRFPPAPIMPALPPRARAIVLRARPTGEMAVTDGADDALFFASDPAHPCGAIAPRGGPPRRNASNAEDR